jgi:hypothetical protein
MLDSVSQPMLIRISFFRYCSLKRAFSTKEFLWSIQNPGIGKPL